MNTGFAYSKSGAIISEIFYSLAFYKNIYIMTKMKDFQRVTSVDVYNEIK